MPNSLYKFKPVDDLSGTRLKMLRLVTGWTEEKAQKYSIDHPVATNIRLTAGLTFNLKCKNATCNKPTAVVKDEGTSQIVEG